MKTISIVIPTWNGENRLKKNLPKVLAVAKKNHIKEIIVVDDKSKDNSVKVIKNEFPEVTLLQKDKNTGFSSTVNLGVSKTSADLVVLLNNDASPKEDFLDALLPLFDDQEVFSVSCNVGGIWNKAEFKNGFFWHSQAKDGGYTDKPHQTLWASGGSGIFRKDIWDQLGGLDELFDPFYEEDVDLGYRALKRGFINLWEPKSLVEHYKEPGVIATQISSEKVARIAQRNQLQFIWKNITSQNLIRQHKIALIKKILTNPKYLIVFLSAFVNLPKILGERAIEVKESKLTDEEILEIL